LVDIQIFEKFYHLNWGMAFNSTRTRDLVQIYYFLTSTCSICTAASLAQC